MVVCRLTREIVGSLALFDKVPGQAQSVIREKAKDATTNEDFIRCRNLSILS